MTAPKKKIRAGLPILGLVLAITLAAVAFGISIPVVEVIEQEFPDVKSQFNDLRANFDDPLRDYIVEIVIAGLLWFMLLGLAMFVASVALGSGPEKDVYKDMPPSPANKKAMVKQMKKDLREAKRAAKAQQRQKRE